MESSEQAIIRLMERISLLESALRDAIKLFTKIKDYGLGGPEDLFELIDESDEYEEQYRELIEELEIEDDE